VGLHFGWNFFFWLFNFPVNGIRYPNPLLVLEYNEYSPVIGSRFGPEDSVLIAPAIIAMAIYCFLVPAGDRGISGEGAWGGGVVDSEGREDGSGHRDRRGGKKGTVKTLVHRRREW